MRLPSANAIEFGENLHFFIAASLSARYLSLSCDNYFAVRIWIELMSGIRFRRNSVFTGFAGDFNILYIA